MAFTKKEREEYNRHREHTGKELGLDKNKYNALRRVSHSLHRISEDSAMGRTDWRHKNDSHGSKQYGEKEYKRDVGKSFSKAEALRKKLGGKQSIHFYHQTDPRGTALYAGKKRMSQSNYNSEGRPIY